MQQVNRCDGRRVNVWAGIHYGCRTALVHAAGALMGIRYRDKILQHHIILHMRLNGGMFQHDDARPHVGCVSQEFVQCHNVQTLTWPACSLDLKLNRTFMRCTRSEFMPEESPPPTPHPRYFHNFLWHCSLSSRTFHNVVCNI